MPAQSSAARSLSSSRPSSDRCSDDSSRCPSSRSGRWLDTAGASWGGSTCSFENLWVRAPLAAGASIGAASCWGACGA